MKKKIVFIVNHAAFFVSHRLLLAKEIIKRGWDFHLIVGNPASKKMEVHALRVLKKNKIKFTTTNFKSNFSLNLINEIIALINIVLILIRINPNIVHLVSPKAILLGGLACKITNKKNIVIAISGLGSLITFKKNVFHKIAQKIYFFSLKNFIYGKNTKIIFQNYDDKNFIKKKLKLKKNNSFFFIPGSGVILKKFKQKKYVIKNIVLMVSRILIDKGVKQYFDAAGIIKEKYPNWKFLLIGPVDYKSHAAINIKEFKKLLQKKSVIWINYKENIDKYIKDASIICLPSFREGMSKFLIEGVAASKPIITTDVPGCRELVVKGKTGFLVKPNSSKSLAEGLLKLIENKKKLKKFNKNYKSLNINKFDVKEVLNKTMKIYNQFDKLN